MPKAKTKAEKRKARKNKKAARARRSYERRRYREPVESPRAGHYDAGP